MTKKKTSPKRDQYTVVLEDIRSQNKVFGEGLMLFREETATQLGQVNKILVSHTEMVGEIMERLEEIKGEMRQKVDYSDFNKLERRVAHLEAHRR